MPSSEPVADITEQTVSRLLEENKRLRDRVYILEQRCEELYWNYTTRPKRMRDRLTASVQMTIRRAKRIIKAVLPQQLVDKLRHDQ